MIKKVAQNGRIFVSKGTYFVHNTLMNKIQTHWNKNNYLNYWIFSTIEIKLTCWTLDKNNYLTYWIFSTIEIKALVGHLICSIDFVNQ